MAEGIGSHMASLNLFREADGSYEITVADARGFIEGPLGDVPTPRAAPIYYVELAIIAAAERMKARHAQARPLVRRRRVVCAKCELPREICACAEARAYDKANPLKGDK